MIGALCYFDVSIMVEKTNALTQGPSGHVFELLNIRYDTYFFGLVIIKVLETKPVLIMVPVIIKEEPRPIFMLPGDNGRRSKGGIILP
jgi:hypothetical protein